MSTEDYCALNCVRDRQCQSFSGRQAWDCKKGCLRECNEINNASREEAVDNIVTAIVEHKNTADLLLPSDNTGSQGTLSTLNGVFGGLSSLLSQATELGERFASHYKDIHGRSYVTDVNHYYTSPAPSPAVCAALSENIRAAIAAANTPASAAEVVPKVCDFMDGTFLNCDADTVKAIRDKLADLEKQEEQQKCLIAGIKFQVLLHGKMLETCIGELNDMNSECNAATATSCSTSCCQPPVQQASCGCGV